MLVQATREEGGQLIFLIQGLSQLLAQTQTTESTALACSSKADPEQVQWCGHTSLSGHMAKAAAEDFF